MVTRIALCLVLLSGLSSGQSDVRKMFERARLLQEKNKDLPQALRLYSEVVRLGKAERALAAQAQFEQGVLLWRLGRKDEAMRAFRVVIIDFPEETDLVRQARARLSAAAPSAGPVVRELFEADVGAFIAVSPDGRYIAQTDQSTGDLAIRDVLTGEAHRLTNRGTLRSPESAQAMGCVFSPQGNRIAYVWMPEIGRLEVRVIHMDGSGDRLLLAGVGVASLQDWSGDDSKLLVLLARKGEAPSLATIAVTTGAVTPLTLPSPRNVSRALFSKDGNFVVFNALDPRDATLDIYAFSLADGSETSLVEHAANGFLAGWSPDGKLLLFESNRAVSLGLWGSRITKGKTQGEPELLRSEMTDTYPLAITRKGTLFYLVYTSLMNTYTATLDMATGFLAPLQPVNPRVVARNQYPAWSPDGKYLSWTGPATSGGPSIQIRANAAGEIRELIPKLKGYPGPNWHPSNGRIVAHASDASGKRGIYTIDPTTGDASLLIADEILETTLEGVWSTDGRTLYNRFTDWRRGIYALEVATGQKQVLFAPPPGSTLALENLAISPDGKTLAFQLGEYPAKGQNSLMLMPVGGGAPRRLLSVPGGDSFAFGAFAWTPDSRQIVIARSSGLYAVSVADGQFRPILPTVRGPKMIRLSPDGKTLALVSGQVRAHVWTMDNFLPNGSH